MLFIQEIHIFFHNIHTYKNTLHCEGELLRYTPKPYFMEG